MMKPILSFFITIGLIIIVSGSAWAGFVVQKETHSTDGMTNQPTVEKQSEYYDPDAGKFAMEQMILRFDTGEIIVVNDEDQKFYRNTVDGYCQDIEAMVKKIIESPEYRQAEQMMKQMQIKYGSQAADDERPKPTVISVGKDKVDGYSAEHLRIMVGPEIQHEVWLATDRRLDPLDPTKNRKLGKKAEQFERKFNGCMSKLSRMSPGAQEAPDPLEDRSNFILRIKDEMVDVITVDIEQRSVPASRFEPPAGYRQVGIQEAMTSEGGQNRFDSSRNDDLDYSEQFSESNPDQDRTTEDNGVLVRDAEDVGNHAKEEAHRQSKKAVEDEISDQVRNGIKSFRKLFGN